MTLSQWFAGAAAPAALLVVIEAALKGTLLLALAAALILLLRRSSAAQRHLVWACALAGLVALPALLLALPAWRVQTPVLGWIAPGFGLLAASVEPVAETVPATDLDPVSATERMEKGKLKGLDRSTSAREEQKTWKSESKHVVTTAPVEGGDLQAKVEPKSPPRPAWPAAAFVLWAFGALAVLATFVAGHVVLRLLLRGARPVRDGDWHSLAQEAADRLGLTLPFALLRAEGILVPVATGLLRPRVLLPEGADAWPVDLRRAVLLHELAHVQRHDCLTQAVAQLACAIFWFHPGVWWAASRLQAERELACDDRVLAARTRASDYADHLLGLVRSLRATRLAALGAVAFARPSSLEGRLLAVLDPHRDRRAVGRRAALLGSLAAMLLVLPFAAFEPAAGIARAEGRRSASRTPADPNALRPSRVVVPPDPERSLEQRAAWARSDAGRSGARAWWIAWPLQTSAGLEGGLLSDSWGIELGLLSRRGAFSLEDVIAGREHGTLDPGSHSGKHERAGGPAIVLVRMGSGRPDRVRVQTPELPAEFRGEPLYWLDGVSDEESFAWLRQEAERPGNERLQRRFVETIGFLGRSELVSPYLMTTFRTAASADLRAGAAEALRHHPSEDGVRMLADAARTDPSHEVRRACVESLGHFQTPEALHALLAIASVGNGNEDTRRAAFDALGEKVSRRAPEQQQDRGEPAREPAAPEPAAPEGEPAAPDPDVTDKSAEREQEQARAERRAVRSEQKGEAVPPMPAAEFEVQRQAIESLGRYPEAQSLPRLQRIAEASPNPELRAQAVESIVRLNSPAAFELAEQIAWKNSSSRARQTAVETLGRRLPPRQALEFLARVAHEHPDTDARRMAVEVAGRIDSREALELLESVLKQGTDADVQRQAVESLGRRPEDGIEDRLYDIARSHHTLDVRRQAVESLGRRPGERISARLMEIARADGPSDVRRQAAESLGRREDPRARELLLELVRGNGSVDVQRQAVESLGRLEEDVMPDLARIARSHPSSDVRRQAVDSMTRRDPDKALPLLEEILRQPR